MATSLMKKTIKNKGVASIEEPRDMYLQADVEMAACQMTVDLFGWSQEDFILEVREWVGAASFLPRAQQADVSQSVYLITDRGQALVPIVLCVNSRISK